MEAKILKIPENLELGWASAKLVEPKEVLEMMILKKKKMIRTQRLSQRKTLGLWHNNLKEIQIPDQKVDLAKTSWTLIMQKQWLSQDQLQASEEILSSQLKKVKTARRTNPWTLDHLPRKRVSRTTRENFQKRDKLLENWDLQD
jgi:hypothetical protein